MLRRDRSLISEEKILLNKIESYKNSSNKRFNDIKLLIEEKNNRIKESLSYLENQYKQVLFISKEIYETKVQSLNATINTVKNLAQEAQKNLSNINDIEKEIKKLENKLNNTKDELEKLKKDYHRIEFEIEDIEKRFNIEYGRYEESKRFDSKKALEILREMLKMDKRYNQLHIKQIKLQNTLKLVQNEIDTLEELLEGLRSKKMDNIINLHNKLYLQEFLTTPNQQDISEEDLNYLKQDNHLLIERNNKSGK